MKKKGIVEFVGFVENVEDDTAKIKIFQKFCEGLKGVENYSHLIVLYWIHLRDTEKDRQTLLVYPKRHAVNILTGVFACRSPSRPNPIGLCVVKLVRRENCTLTVKGLDALENSPIIDIKPYIPKLDSVPDAQVPKWAC
ncbi:MAG: tRNA (N6-threonylcarbamoyladenosine(37)-N6)-methyltransferase TrmO [Candidatus Bathyarchaeia archaeon]